MKSIYCTQISVKNYKYSLKAFELKSLLKYPTPLGKPSECFSIRFEKFDSMIAAGYSNGNIVIYNIETKEHLKFFSATDYPITSLRWKPHSDDKPKNILLSSTADGKIIHWHTLSGRTLHTIEEPDNPVMCLDYNSDGSLFAAAGNDKKVKLYDEQMKVKINTMKSGGFNHPGHSNRIFSVCFHKENNNLLASGGWDNTVQFYDLKTSQVVNSIFGPHICGDSIDLKGNYLLTGSWDTKNQIQLWDIRNFQLVETLNWDKNRKESNTHVYSAQFSKRENSNMFGVGCSNNNIYRIFDMDKENLPITGSDYLWKPVYTVDFSNNGNYFAYGSGDGNVRILQLGRNKEIEI